MPKLVIDGIDVEVPEGATVFQACQLAEKEIPHFCYHPRLKIAGNCRMCLVEVEKSPKLVASCAMPAGEGMVVHTNSDKVKSAREGVMEFLLINHPLDCPICDQGGECDLQDQAMAYGRDHTRCDEGKRAVVEKHMGPLIKTHMTRCIHCTRCVRFADEVAGVPALGAIGRGNNMEITTYQDQAFSSELSGNVIDLCPVGALTSRPYAYKGRPWELTKTESIDVFDAMGCNIRIDTYGQKVRRILPRLNEDINEEWISDKARYACDALSQQRLDRPYVRNEQGVLQAATWTAALKAVADKLRSTVPERIGAITGNFADAEAMTALKDLFEGLGSGNLDCRQDKSGFSNANRSSYLFNSTIAGIDEADVCLLVGTHPRYEAPVLNARLRKRYLEGGFKIARIGASAKHAAQELTYPVTELGANASVIEGLLQGKHEFSKALKDAKRPMIIVGEEAFTRSDGSLILAKAAELADQVAVKEDWNGFNVLHTAASRVAGLDLGFLPGPKGLDTKKMIKEGLLDVLYLLGADEIAPEIPAETFVIYQGHHGDKGAMIADIVLPGAAYTEKEATYVNMEGRVQRTYKACPTPGEAKEDWKIIRALSEHLPTTLSYITLEDMRSRMSEINTIFETLDTIQAAEWIVPEAQGSLLKSDFKPWAGEFYMTDSISRNSPTMAACRKTFEESLTAEKAA